MSEEGLLCRIMDWVMDGSAARVWLCSIGFALLSAMVAIWLAAALGSASATYNTQVHGEPSPPVCKVIRYRLGYDAACAIECRRGEHRWSTPIPCEHMGKQVRREFVP